MRPDRSPHPLPLFEDVGVCLLDQCTDSAERLATPIAKLGDPSIDIAGDAAWAAGLTAARSGVFRGDATVVALTGDPSPAGPGFLKKFYGWYLERGRFPRPFKQELVQLQTTEEVVTRLFAAAPGALDIVAQLEAELPDTEDEILLDQMPISIYGGG